MTDAEQQTLRDIEAKQNELLNKARTLLEQIELRDAAERNHYYEFSLQNHLQHVVDHMENAIDSIYDIKTYHADR